MGERLSPPINSNRMHVPSGDFLVSPEVTKRTYLQGANQGPAFDPGETIYLTEYTRRTGIEIDALRPIVKNLERVGRVNPGEGLVPAISFVQGTAAEHSAGIAKVAKLVSEHEEFFQLVRPADSEEPFPPTRKRAQQLVKHYVDEQNHNLTISKENTPKTDTITELSSADVIAALRIRQKEIMRPDDPIDLHLDRMAVIHLAEAVVMDQEVQIPHHALGLFNAYTSGVLEPGATYTRYKIRTETNMSEDAVQRGLDGMRQVGMITTSQRLVVGGVYLNEHTFSGKYVDVIQNQYQSDQNELDPGAALLNRLLNDVTSHESTTVEGAYMRVAAAHMLEAALQNRLFDSHADTESISGYASALLSGSHGGALASIFTHIENGEIDTSQVHPRNYLHKNFPGYFINHHRADAVRTILEYVGLMRFESPGKHTSIPNTETFPQIGESAAAKISTEELVQRLIDRGEKNSKMLAAIANITEGEAGFYLKRDRQQKAKDAHKDAMHGGEKFVFVNSKVGTLVTEQGNLYVKTVEDGITIIRRAA